MKFEKFFRFISYLAVFCGFLSLWVSGSFGLVGSGIFIAFIVAAWFLEGTRWQLSERVGTTLIVAAVPVYYLLSRLQSAPTASSTGIAILVGLLGRLIVTLTAIKLLQKKSDRDWIFLYLMAFFEILLAAGLSISAVYLATFVLYLLVMVCTIIAFEIRKTSRNVIRRTTGLIKNEDETQAESSLSIRRLPTMAVGLITVIVCIGLPLFFFLPRVGGAGLGSGGAGVSTRSGFSDVVKLGGIGSIQENNEIVMRARLEGVAGEQTDLYWRGLALDTFDGKSWERSERGVDTYARGEREIIPVDLLSSRNNVLVQTIYLEPLDTPYLFGLPKVAGVVTSFPAIQKDTDGDLSISRPSERISYRILSDRGTPSLDVLRADDKRYSDETVRFLQLPPTLDKRIANLAAEITWDKTNRFDKARAVEQYLQTQLSYTLELKAGGPDPLADFLFNVRQGHCEYFATAMAIMLRTQGIATRIVNGFHQGDYNDTVDTYVIRQKNAHSWVEVYFPKTDFWIKFDPTPPAGQTAPSSISGFTGSISKYLEALETYWIQYFVAYDNQEQRSLARSMRTGFTDYLQNISSYFSQAKAVVAAWWSEVRGDFGNERSVSALGTAVGYFALLIAAVLLISWLVRDVVKLKVWRRIADWLYGRRPASIVEFYDRMQKILASKGWVREPHQTPLEFSYAVGMPEAVSVTEKYNRVRFGEKGLTTTETTEIESWLSDLETTDVSR